jgi:hypothetical protein
VESTSATSKSPTNALMFTKVRMLKDKMFRFMADTMVLTKDGRFFILTRKERLKQRVSMRNSDSTLTDHSTLSQSFHSTELLSATEPTMSGSEDGERILLLNSGGSMRFPRQSEITTGRTTPSKSKAMVTPITLELLELTQDGGRCSDTKVASLPTRKERSWLFLADSIMNKETLWLKTKMARFTKGGR